MLQLIIISVTLVTVAILLIGINVFFFGRKFPETEVGRNPDMIKLGLRCPKCEESTIYHPVRQIRYKTLKPDWELIKGHPG
jgi:hypothetical protein